MKRQPTGAFARRNDDASNRAFLAEMIVWCRAMMATYPSRGYELSLAKYEKRMTELQSTEE